MTRSFQRRRKSDCCIEKLEARNLLAAGWGENTIADDGTSSSAFIADQFVTDLASKSRFAADGEPLSSGRSDPAEPEYRSFKIPIVVDPQSQVFKTQVLTGEASNATVDAWTFDLLAGDEFAFVSAFEFNDGVVQVLSPSGEIIAEDFTTASSFQNVAKESGTYQLLIREVPTYEFGFFGTRGFANESFLYSTFPTDNPAYRAVDWQRGETGERTTNIAKLLYAGSVTTVTESLLYLGTMPAESTITVDATLPEFSTFEGVVQIIGAESGVIAVSEVVLGNANRHTRLSIQVEQDDLYVLKTIRLDGAGLLASVRHDIQVRENAPAEVVEVQTFFESFPLTEDLVAESLINAIRITFSEPVLSDTVEAGVEIIHAGNDGVFGSDDDRLINFEVEKYEYQVTRTNPVSATYRLTSDIYFPDGKIRILTNSNLLDLAGNPSLEEAAVTFRSKAIGDDVLEDSPLPQFVDVFDAPFVELATERSESGIFFESQTGLGRFKYLDKDVFRFFANKGDQIRLVFEDRAPSQSEYKVYFEGRPEPLDLGVGLSRHASGHLHVDETGYYYVELGTGYLIGNEYRFKIQGIQAEKVLRIEEQSNTMIWPSVDFTNGRFRDTYRLDKQVRLKPVEGIRTVEESSHVTIRLRDLPPNALIKATVEDYPIEAISSRLVGVGEHETVGDRFVVGESGEIDLQIRFSHDGSGGPIADNVRELIWSALRLELDILLSQDVPEIVQLIGFPSGAVDVPVNGVEVVGRYSGLNVEGIDRVSQLVHHGEDAVFGTADDKIFLTTAAPTESPEIEHVRLAEDGVLAPGWYSLVLTQISNDEVGDQEFAYFRFEVSEELDDYVLERSGQTQSPAVGELEFIEGESEAELKTLRTTVGVLTDTSDRDDWHLNLLEGERVSIWLNIDEHWRAPELQVHGPDGEAIENFDWRRETKGAVSLRFDVETEGSYRFSLSLEEFHDQNLHYQINGWVETSALRESHPGAFVRLQTHSGSFSEDSTQLETIFSHQSIPDGHDVSVTVVQSTRAQEIATPRLYDERLDVFLPVDLIDHSEPINRMQTLSFRMLDEEFDLVQPLNFKEDGGEESDVQFAVYAVFKPLELVEVVDIPSRPDPLTNGRPAPTRLEFNRPVVAERLQENLRLTYRDAGSTTKLEVAVRQVDATTVEIHPPQIESQEGDFELRLTSELMSPEGDVLHLVAPLVIRWTVDASRPVLSRTAEPATEPSQSLVTFSGENPSGDASVKMISVYEWTPLGDLNLHYTRETSTTQIQHPSAANRPQSIWLGIAGDLVNQSSVLDLTGSYATVTPDRLRLDSSLFAASVGALPQVVLLGNRDLRLTGEWVVKRPTFVDGQWARTATAYGHELTVVGGRSLQNPVLTTDVNGDGVTTSVDALQVINALRYINYSSDDSSDFPGLVNSGFPADQLTFLDVNADGRLSAIDALRVINSLTRTMDATVAGEEVSADQEGTVDLAIAEWGSREIDEREERQLELEFQSTLF